MKDSAKGRKPQRHKKASSELYRKRGRKWQNKERKLRRHLEDQPNDLVAWHALEANEANRRKLK